MPTKLGGDETFNIIRVGNYTSSSHRMPAVYFQSNTTALEVRTLLDGKKYEIRTDEIPLNSWTHVEISQMEEPADVFEFIIRINNIEVHRKRNNEPAVNYDVKVYASDHSWPAAHARIQNITHETWKWGPPITSGPGKLRCGPTYHADCESYG